MSVTMATQGNGGVVGRVDLENDLWSIAHTDNEVEVQHLFLATVRVVIVVVITCLRPLTFR